MFVESKLKGVQRSACAVLVADCVFTLRSSPGEYRTNPNTPPGPSFLQTPVGETDDKETTFRSSGAPPTDSSGHD